MRLKEGDEVGYKSVRSDTKFNHIGKVYELAPDGIASCPKPMLKIEGKAGFVLESHCILFPKQPTAAEINACPESVKAYIHDLIAVEPSGAVQDLAMSRDNAAGLAARVKELEKAVKALQKESDDEFRKRKLADERAGFAAKQSESIARERDSVKSQGEVYRRETHRWKQAYTELDEKWKAAGSPIGAGDIKQIKV